MEIIGEVVLIEGKMNHKPLITKREEGVSCAENHTQILFFARNYRYIFLSEEMLNLFLLQYASYVCTLGLKTDKIADTHLAIYGKNLTVRQIRHIICYVTCVRNMARVTPGGKSITTHN